MGACIFFNCYPPKKEQYKQYKKSISSVLMQTHRKVCVLPLFTPNKTQEHLYTKLFVAALLDAYGFAISERFYVFQFIRTHRLSKMKNQIYIYAFISYTQILPLHNSTHFCISQSPIKLTTVDVRWCMACASYGNPKVVNAINKFFWAEKRLWQCNTWFMFR